MEWLLGDLSNLLGSIFTRQASWQIIIASYYCFVDCMLVGQWIWYEQLEHGRQLRSVWARRKDDTQDGDSASISSEFFDNVSIASSQFDSSSPPDKSSPGTPRPIPHSRATNIFHTPNFSRSPSVYDFSSGNNTPTSRAVLRPGNAGSPMPSPRTILYISLLLAVLSTASPIQDSTHSVSMDMGPPVGPDANMLRQHSSATETAGKIISWFSTLLYLGSRLPQLYKNHIRRSTAGLSPTLFAAAFFGNLFYSSSLLTNPCAWNDYPKDDQSASRGWIGPEGSVRSDWILRAMPFFLGAAGVLLMDAMIGLQFWWFGSQAEERVRADRREIVVFVVPDEDGRIRKSRNRKWRWRRVSGWMRGWIPSASAIGMPVKGPSGPEEQQGLLGDAGAREYGATGRSWWFGFNQTTFVTRSYTSVLRHFTSFLVEHQFIIQASASLLNGLAFKDFIGLISSVYVAEFAWAFRHCQHSVWINVLEPGWCMDHGVREWLILSHRVWRLSDVIDDKVFGLM
jgi:solute carrier family 66 (lysosomal lysine-arginine transporter), member 1